jgi:ABC-type multidrug transport system ATPase subunit
MTLILAPPGHGKTAFLRALGGRLAPTGGAGVTCTPSACSLTGSVTFNGHTQAQLAAAGVHLSKLVSFAHQSDTHLPQLTVRETLQFAAANMLPPPTHPALADEPALAAAIASRVDDVLRLLELTDCADTPVGSDVVRGISGGQRKRLTVAEAVLALPRILLLDEVTSGLDAGVAARMMAALRAWTAAAGATTVAALQQPSPALVEMCVARARGARGIALCDSV